MLVNYYKSTTTKLLKRFSIFIKMLIYFVFFTVKFTIAALEDGHEENKKGKIEKARFEKLPILKAIVLDTDSIKTPFSKNIFIAPGVEGILAPSQTQKQPFLINIFAEDSSISF